MINILFTMFIHLLINCVRLIDAKLCTLTNLPRLESYLSNTCIERVNQPAIVSTLSSCGRAISCSSYQRPRVVAHACMGSAHV